MYVYHNLFIFSSVCGHLALSVKPSLRRTENRYCGLTNSPSFLEGAAQDRGLGLTFDREFTVAGDTVLPPNHSLLPPSESDTERRS